MMEGRCSVTLITTFQKVSLCTYSLNGETQELRISAKAIFLLVLLGILCLQWKLNELKLKAQILSSFHY